MTERQMEVLSIVGGIVFFTTLIWWANTIGVDRMAGL